MKVTGERLTVNSGMDFQLEMEHLHRYKAISKYVEGKKVLDAACGTGYGSAILAEKAESVIGIDIDADAILFAQANYSKSNTQFKVMSVTDIIQNAEFDCIVSFETLEHLDEMQQNTFMQNIQNALKEDGTLIISTPDRKIYTELISDGVQNSFHINEFYKDEYVSFLKSYFKNVRLYYQNMMELSVISGELGLTSENITFSDKQDSIGKYIIAVCTNKEKEAALIKGCLIPNIKDYYKYKYFTVGSSLFIDNGKGFNEENKIFKQIEVDKEGNFEVEFNLIEYNDVKQIRFDPCECASAVEITGIRSNIGGVTLSPSNSNYRDNSVDFFMNKDPIYLINCERIDGIKYITINGVIRKIGDRDINAYFTGQLNHYATTKKKLIIENARINEKVQRLTAQNYQLTVEKSEVENENVKLYDNIQSLIAETKNMNEQNYIIVTQKKQLEEDFKRIQELNRTHEQGLNNYRREEERLNNVIVEYQQHTSNLEVLLSEYQEKLNQLEEDFKRIQELNRTHELGLNNYRREEERLNNVIVEYQQHTSNLEVLLREYQEKLKADEDIIRQYRESFWWKITKPMRVIGDIGKGMFNRRNWLNAIRKIYKRLPIQQKNKEKVKDILFKIFKPFIKNSEIYCVWEAQRYPSMEKTTYETNKNVLDTDISSSYLSQIMNIPSEGPNGATYVKKSGSQVSLTQEDVKYLAFYLPQFHPIPENDTWWGEGFTEWTNVTKAVPFFEGHYQPRLAGGLGYYDLRMADKIKEQMELAKFYGIYGFCIYYYWFDGKKLLETPLNLIMKNPKLDLPFCLCWANENWSRRWDGKERDVLIEQNYDNDFPLKFIKDIAVYLKDNRYIRVKGKPLLLVYNANEIPNLKNTLLIWRKYCKKIGIGDVHILAVDFALNSVSKAAGFNGYVEFPPHSIYEYSMQTINGNLNFVNAQYKGLVYDYNQIVQEKKYLSTKENHYKGVFLGWDNTARKGNSATVFNNFNIDSFKEWLSDITKHTKKQFGIEEQIVFINAWNEWAEGTYLEPDRRFGYAALDAVRDVIRKHQL